MWLEVNVGDFLRWATGTFVESTLQTDFKEIVDAMGHMDRSMDGPSARWALLHLGKWDRELSMTRPPRALTLTLNSYWLLLLLLLPRTYFSFLLCTVLSSILSNCHCAPVISLISRVRRYPPAFLDCPKFIVAGLQSSWLKVAPLL